MKACQKSLKVEVEDTEFKLNSLVSEITEYETWDSSDDEAKYFVFETIYSEVNSILDRFKWLDIVAKKNFKMRSWNMFIIFHNLTAKYKFDWMVNFYSESGEYEFTIFEENDNEFIVSGKKDDIYMKVVCLFYIRYGLFVV